jgi:T4 bacteriophage base plate protein
MVQSNNPLAKHFRQPAIYIKLPSNGKFWPEAALDLPVTGEIPVYPMTARDEITLRTPDALLNGQGVVDIIQSCCPNIKDAWSMPSIDVDAILLNIRIASYGSNMDFDTDCTACKEESNFTLDISNLVGQIAMPDYTTLLEFDNLKIRLRPQPYFEVNKTNQLTFTEQQILRTINDSTLSDDEKKSKTDEYLQRLIDLNINICANSTQEIITEDGTIVNNPDFIKEYYNMADYKVMRQIQQRLTEINNQAAIKPIHVVCKACKHEYDVPLNFDYANFFA